MAANANIPYITNLVYDGSQLQVTWSPSADTAVTGYEVAVLYGTDTIVFTQSFPAPAAGTLSITESIALGSGQLDSSIACFVQVSTVWGSNPGQGETSQLVAVITQLPELHRAYYDGTNLYFEWTASSQAVQGYALQLLQGTATFYATVAATSATTGMIPASLLPPGGLSTTLSCSAWVSAAGNIGFNDNQGGQSLGNSAVAILPTGLPTVALTSVSYQPNAVSATWTALTAPSEVSGYYIEIQSLQHDSGYTLQVPGLSAAAAVIDFPFDLSAAQSYTFRLIALTASAGGVATPATPIVTTLPNLIAVNYDVTNQTIDLTWQAIPNPAITAYQLEVYATTGTAQSYTTNITTVPATNGTVAIPSGGFSNTQAWAARVHAFAGTNCVPGIGPAQPVYITAPVLQALSCDGRTIIASWNPVAGPYFRAPEGYLVTLTDTTSSSVAANSFTAGSASCLGSVPVPGSDSYALQVTPIGGVTIGNPSTSVQPITAAPSIGGMSVDAITGKATLSWTAPPGADGAALSFVPGMGPVAATGATYEIPGAWLASDSPLSVSIAGTHSGSVAITGPPSEPFRILSGRPSVTQVSYNGTTVTLAWSPLPGASGYTATLLGTTNDTTTAAATSSVSGGVLSTTIAFTAIKGTTYTLVVQGVSGSNGSSMPSAAAGVFSPGVFPSQSGAASCYPFAYPATSLDTVLDPDTAKTGEPITLYLPDLGAGTALTGLPFIQGAFTLAVNGDGTSSAIYPYTLSISNTVTTNNPWSFGVVSPATTPAAIRDGLRSDYVALLTGAETRGVVPWGIGYLQQIIGRILPQTLAEILYYNFGLSFPDVTAGIATGSADLRPGMVLRVAINPYQAVAGQVATSWLNGFVGGSVIDYDVGTITSNAGVTSVGLDAFIGQLVANGALTVQTPPLNRSANLAAGAADAADFGYPGFAGPFYRLFVPSTLLSATSSGSITPTANFVLAPAASYAALVASTNTFAPTGSNVLGYFRGRTNLRLCIRVKVNEVEAVVPIGTTVGNLLERAGRLPAAVSQPLGGITIMRGLGGAVLTGQPSSRLASYPVNLGWTVAGATTYGPNWTALSMPLLPGDSLSFCT